MRVHDKDYSMRRLALSRSELAPLQDMGAAPPGQRRCTHILQEMLSHEVPDLPVVGQPERAIRACDNPLQLSQRQRA